MTALPEPYISLEEYFTLEETSEERHEYYQGNIYAMTGGTGPHSLITSNVMGLLYIHLSEKDCDVYPGYLRIKIETTTLYTYPDAMVVCGPLSYVDNRRDTINNPLVIIEVLSPSTERYDRGKKAENYRTIPTLSEYLLISQDRLHVEHYRREAGNRWILLDYSTPDQEVQLDSIGGSLPMAMIYKRVQFDEAETE